MVIQYLKNYELFFFLVKMQSNFSLLKVPKIKIEIYGAITFHETHEIFYLTD